MNHWVKLLSQLSTTLPSVEQQLAQWQVEPETQYLAILKGYAFIGANEGVIRYFQTQEDSFINATPYDFSPRIQSSGKNSVEYTQQLIQKANQGQVVHFNWLHMSQLGTELPTKVTLYPVMLAEEQAILALFEPVNRRSRARTNISNGFENLPSQLLSTILQDSAEAVYITNHQHEIIAVNKAMCRICGYSADQLLHKKPESIGLHQVTLDNDNSYKLSLAERGSWQGETVKQRSDGTHFPAWKSCRKILVDQDIFYVTLFSDISAKKKLESKLTEQAMVDTLTGLPNRHHLKQLLNQALIESRNAPGTLGAVMFMDLNGFKNINDCFGHATGDKVLQLVSARLEASCIEKADIARLGGDEFTLILQDCHDRAEVEAFSQQMLGIFDAPFEIDGQKFYLGSSVGIALFPEHSTQASQLLSLADTAMYCAKKSPNHVLFYDADMHRQAEKKLKLLSDLRHAHSLKQFKLAYQVIVNLECNSVIGAEALLRWQQSDGTIIPASEFVPYLEETGLLIPVGQWVLVQACTQVANWRTEHHSELQACVNVSPLQLEHPDFIKHVHHALEQSQLAPDSLVLEITESALLRQPERVKSTLAELKSIGVRIAIDDFGAGLSSLSKLGSLPIDTLKIDAGFAKRLSEPQGKELCQAMIQLAQALNIQFVVEGIETLKQKQILAAMGKGFGQGYFFGHPESAEQFNSANFDN
ncbi:bifunctional diguanylate cyclase/phosphodiesterase [Shewanella colwelliana]|uniref:Diguanylate cyclase n=1 Tax=Shewanella colwelliana TaxID=23 RepID=A0A1E5IXC2_SHECO|nr:EAL domain-containing protein [Shewanella colwelliana]MDX1280690.1 EAL domain-containing protein [Shewanella colwelliana]OEG74808.1 diguanylate cyclase [Shewanella colwelliana]